MIFSTTIRLVFISTLFLIFLLYFGCPSYRRFNKKDTVFSENQVSVDHARPVMITIFAWKGISFNGWKDQTVGYENLTGICNSTDEYDKMIECIINKTYEHEDIISKCTTGEDDIDVKNKTTWIQGITKFSAGRFHSTKIYPTIFHNEKAEQEWQMNIYLKSNQNYTFVIHDPDFFPFTRTPDTIPNILINMDDSRSQQVIIRAVYTKKMNEAKYTCISDKSYSFTTCVANSVSAKVGCRLELDNLSSQEFPECTRVGEIIEIAGIYERLSAMMESVLVNYTGCSLPCTYVEYRLIKEPVKFKESNQRFVLIWLSSKAVERSEQLLYPIESFISEFGGALGLFLGFSFMQIWDISEEFIKMSSNKFINNKPIQ